MEVQSIAIRYPQLDKSAADLAGMRPIVFSAEQGICGAMLPSLNGLANPLKAGIEQNHVSIDKASPKDSVNTIQQFQINRIIFVVDRSGSMGDQLIRGQHSAETKLQHTISQFSKFPSTCLQSGTKISLVSFDDSAVEHLERDNSDLDLTIKHTRKIMIGGGTSFSEPLSIVKEILISDQSTSPTDNRSLVVFLTDGQDDKSRNPLIIKLLNDIRSLNAAMFVGGIGEDYSMARIIEIASLVGYAAWGHTPIATDQHSKDALDYDIFQGFIPRMLDGMNYSEGYLGFHAKGDFHNLTSASQSIFPAAKDSNSLFPGYVRTARGLLLEGQHDNIELKLSFAPSISSLDKYTSEIQIIDAEDAGAHFEDKELGQKLIDQWLAARAIRNRDLDALNQLSQKHPDQDIYRDIIDRIQQHTQYGGDSNSGNSQLYSDETVCGTWMEHRTKRSDQSNSFNDTKQVNQFSRLDSNSLANNNDSVDQGLHSGPLGPLSDSATINSLPPAHKPNAHAYNSIPKRNSPHLIQEGSRSKHKIDLSKLISDGKAVLLGRNDKTVATPESDAISRRHCKISIQDGVFYITDLQSRNGTFLNEKLIPAHVPQPLKSGDRVRFGGITLIFHDK
jgi:hypothetical protein